MRDSLFIRACKRRKNGAHAGLDYAAGGTIFAGISGDSRTARFYDDVQNAGTLIRGNCSAD